MADHYILAGKVAVPAIDMLTWAKWFENHDRKVVFTNIAKDIDVSTVFLGLNHQFAPNAPPLIFETLVFGGPLDQDMDRYTTWEQAEQGHKEMVQKVLDAIDHNGTEG